MRKSLLLVALLVFLLLGCSRYHIVEYQPNSNDKQPQKTIERLIRSQPSDWGVVPYMVSAKPDCIDMMMLEERKSRGQKFTTEVSKIICYKNIGKVVLSKHSSGVWCIDIHDRLGTWLYKVNCYEEADAKGFIDALYTMKGSK